MQPMIGRLDGFARAAGETTTGVLLELFSVHDEYPGWFEGPL